MRLLVIALAFAFLPACSGGGPIVVSKAELAVEDENSFRQLRQDFHLAAMTGDFGLMRSLWADGAVLTTAEGVVLVGPDEITAYLAANPDFGKLLVLTSESSWTVEMRGDIAEYGFETISVDVGSDVPGTTPLSIAGAQNPAVEIVGHNHSTGMAQRLGDGRWVFKELSGGLGPLPSAALAQTDPIAVDDELGFRRMRETFHLANISGDAELMRSVWADDAVFVTGGGDRFEGGDAITEFFATRPAFGKRLVLTPESSQRIVVNGDIIQYGFECIAIDVGDNDPQSIDLCTIDGTQNPDVEIVMHTNSQGFAQRVADGRWVFKEFNGGSGPLPPQ